MLSFGVFFALFTVAVGSPTQSLLSGELGAEFTPHPGCHYNITGQAHFNFKVHNGAFKWYFDTVTATIPLRNVTCLELSGEFNMLHAFEILQTNQHLVIDGRTVDEHCGGRNYEDAPADFPLACKVAGCPTPLTSQFRIADSDRKSYVLITACSGPSQGPFVETMGILGPNKNGVDPAIRKRLVKRLVQAGWNPKYIQRVPFQSGC